MAYSNDLLTDHQCDGLPKLPIASIKGTCLGLVISNDAGVNLIKPRKAIDIPESQQASFQMLKLAACYKA
jgi:hypothetical protein